MPPRKPTTPPVVLQPGAIEDHRTRLIALRDRLTDEITTAPAAYIAGLARQLQATLEALAALPPAAGTSAVDQLAARARARLKAAGVPDAPTRSRRGGTDE